MAMGYVIGVIPFFGQGHTLLTMEWCKNIASRNFKTTLVIYSDLISSIPSSVSHQSPLLQVAELPPLDPDPSATHPFHHHFNHHSQMAQGIQNLIFAWTLQFCAVVDVMMAWTTQIFIKLDIPKSVRQQWSTEEIRQIQ